MPHLLKLAKTLKSLFPSSNLKTTNLPFKMLNKSLAPEVSETVLKKKRAVFESLHPTLLAVDDNITIQIKGAASLSITFDVLLYLFFILT